MDRVTAATDYAEEQRYSHAILTTHVLHRGVNFGALLGSIYGGARYGFSARARKSPLAALVVGGAGVGVVVTTGVAAAVLSWRMYGRQEIEWQDRSWRLLQNGPQNRLDEWSAPGAFLGGILGGAKAGLPPGSRWRGVAGGAGIGSVIGIAAWAVYNKAKGKEEVEANSEKTTARS